MTLEWVRLYRDERGTFAQLPLFTRAFAAQLLKLTNDEGVIEIGRKDPADAVCFALGAEPNERRAVRRHMELLFADGYVVHDIERQHLVLPGFPRFQGHTLQRSEERPPRAQRASNTPPTRAHAAPNATPASTQRDSGEHPTNIQSASNVLPDWPKSTESHGGTEGALNDQSREEKKREEESRSTDAPPADASPAQGVQDHPTGSIGAILAMQPAVRPCPPLTTAPDGPCQLPEFTEAVLRAVRKQVHDLYTAKVGYSHDLNGKHVERLTHTLRGVAHARGEALPVVVERTVAGYLADPYWQKSRWPLNGLVSQAARYADPTKPEDIVVVDHGKNQAKIGSLRSKLSAAETERKLAASMNPGALAKIDQQIDGLRREVKRLEGAA